MSPTVLYTSRVCAAGHLFKSCCDTYCKRTARTHARNDDTRPKRIQSKKIRKSSCSTCTEHSRCAGGWMGWDAFSRHLTAGEQSLCGHPHACTNANNNSQLIGTNMIISRQLFSLQINQQIFQDDHGQIKHGGVLQVPGSRNEQKDVVACLKKAE
jgi:hypothetical protein